MPVKLEALLVWELSKVAIPIDEDLNTDPATTTDTCEGDAEDADFLRFLLRRKITKGPGARAAGIAMAFKLGAAVLGLRDGTQRCSPRPP